MTRELTGGGTRTGRFQSKPCFKEIESRERQTLKRFIRSQSKLCRHLLAVDFAAIEQRILAIEKPDIHTEAAAIIFDKPPAEVTIDERRFAKNINFMIRYGIGTGVRPGDLLKVYVRKPRGGNDVRSNAD